MEWNVEEAVSDERDANELDGHEDEGENQGHVKDRNEKRQRVHESTEKRRDSRDRTSADWISTTRYLTTV